VCPSDVPENNGYLRHLRWSSASFLNTFSVDIPNIEYHGQHIPETLLCAWISPKSRML
jgi:hypothetical protein